MSKSIENLKKANETKDKYMLVRNDSINAKQLLHILQKTPKKYVYKRKGRGGKEFIYVKGQYIKKVLNFVFGWLWDFEIKEHGKEGNQIWVLGRLVIKNKKMVPIIVKEQFGRAEIKKLRDGSGNVDFGNDLKAAATDSLKKCASELGIASDVYNYEEDVETDTVVAEVKVEEKSSVSPFQKTISDIRSTRNIGTLKSWAEQIKKSDIWNETQKRTLLNNIQDQIKSL